MSGNPTTARGLFDRYEPIHAPTYFAPEAGEALGQAGFRGFWMGYLGARAAPLGSVRPDVVTAVCHDFAPRTAFRHVCVTVVFAQQGHWRAAGSPSPTAAILPSAGRT